MTASGSPVWINAKGQEIVIADMTDRHLLSVIFYLKRDAFGNARRRGGTWEDHFSERGRSLLAEAQRRGLQC